VTGNIICHSQKLSRKLENIGMFVCNSIIKKSSLFARGRSCKRKICIILPFACHSLCILGFLFILLVFHPAITILFMMMCPPGTLEFPTAIYISECFWVHIGFTFLRSRLGLRIQFTQEDLWIFNLHLHLDGLSLSQLLQASLE